MSGPPVPALPHSSFAPFLWDSEAREEPDGDLIISETAGDLPPRRSVDSLEKGQDGLIFLLFSNEYSSQTNEAYSAQTKSPPQALCFGRALAWQKSDRRIPRRLDFAGFGMDM